MSVRRHASGATLYMQQRYYDPIAGRFLSVDPVTTNAKDGSFFGRYHYANNNPYKFKDPDGRAADTIFDLGFAAYDGGKFLGAAAAWAVGKLTGVANLAAEGAAGMRATGTDAAASLAAVAIPGLPAAAVRGAGAVSDATVVCRGGGCTAQSFAKGSGVTTDAATGKLSGISTGLGSSVAEASKNIPHGKVGVTTAGDIRAAGGQVVNDRGNHGTVSGLTAEKAAEVFKDVVKNPNK